MMVHVHIPMIAGIKAAATVKKILVEAVIAIAAQSDFAVFCRDT